MLGLLKHCGFYWNSAVTEQKYRNATDFNLKYIDYVQGYEVTKA